MIAIRDLFLRAKAWQIFALLVGPFAIGILGHLTMPRYPWDLVSVVLGVVGVGWYWSVGSFLAVVVKDRLQMNVKWFHLAVAYTCVYFPVYIFVAVSPYMPPFALIFPLHLLAMVGMFYALYFVTVALVLAEPERPPTFSNTASKLFLLWFYPIGVWVIQPGINRNYATVIGKRSATNETK